MTKKILTKSFRCRTCGKLVRSRDQWLSEKCAAFPSGKSGHLIPSPGLLPQTAPTATR